LYYYAGYATNSTGTGYSADGTFTTLGNLGGACTVTGIIPVTKDQSSGTTIVVNKPVSVVQNDLILIYIGHENATYRINSIPSGWTEAGRNSGGTSQTALFYKVAGASEPVSYTFGFSASVRSGLSLSVYRGCFKLANPIAVISNTPYVVSNTTFRAASMNLPSPYSNVIVFPGVVVTGNKTFNNPLTQGGGWTEVYDFGNASSRFSRSAFSKLITSSGLTGDIDSVGSYSGTTLKHSFGIGLNPL
jgi:hypothetical protein